MSGFDSILTKREDPGKAAIAELIAAATDPDSYRAAIIRPRAQAGFSVIEADGTMHGFAYHTLRHPKHQVRDEDEFLSFSADGIVVVMQGTGLRVLFLALVRHALAEVRAYDGRPVVDGSTRITRLEVIDTQEEPPKREPAARLVK